LDETAVGKYLKVMKHLFELYWKMQVFACNESLFLGRRRQWSKLPFNIDGLGTSFGT